MKCSECKWYFPKTNKVGECRLDPPKDFKFGPTKPDWFCSHFEKKNQLTRNVGEPSLNTTKKGRTYPPF